MCTRVGMMPRVHVLLCNHGVRVHLSAYTHMYLCVVHMCTPVPLCLHACVFWVHVRVCVACRREEGAH